MRNSRVATRYAKALLLLSSEAGTLEEDYGDMKLLIGILKESKELQNLLKSPIIKTDKKITILTKIFENKISKTSMIFINTITTKKRESLLQIIAESFIKNYKKEKGIRTVTVTTAVAIDQELKTQITNSVKNEKEENIELIEIVDKNIIGGSIIRVDDIQLDTSLSNKILELKQTFNKNLYIQDF